MPWLVSASDEETEEVDEVDTAEGRREMLRSDSESCLVQETDSTHRDESGTGAVYTPRVGS